jgi:hypothetical protein
MYGNEEEGEAGEEEEIEVEEEAEEVEAHAFKRAKKGESVDSVELSIGALFPGMSGSNLATIAEGLERLQRSQPFDHAVSGGDSGEGSDGIEEVPGFAEFFLRRSARDFMIPPDSIDSSPYLVAERGLSGVGSLLHLLEAPVVDAEGGPDHPLRLKRPATLPNEHSHPTPSVRSGGRGGRGTPMLGTVAFSKQKDVCAGISIVGSPFFVNAHLCGTANGIPVASSDSFADFTRCLSRISTEVAKLDQVRLQNGAKGLGLVIGEVNMPKNPEKRTLEWEITDEFMQKWINELPFGTCIVVATQGDVNVDSTGDAAYGVTMIASPNPTGQL